MAMLNNQMVMVFVDYEFLQPRASEWETVIACKSGLNHISSAHWMIGSLYLGSFIYNRIHI